MSLAQRASPPPSDGTPQGAEDARAGYAVKMTDPPASYGLPPILYAGDYGAFSRPSRGDPLRGEAVAYLMSWAARMSAAAGTATVPVAGGGGVAVPQPVWDAGTGEGTRLAWLKGAFQVPSYQGPRFDLFRMRLLDFLRLRRAPVGVPCDGEPPEPRSWLASWSDDDSGGYDEYDPSPPPDLASPPVFARGYLAAETQAGVDANGGKWLVPAAAGAEDLPFGAGSPADVPKNRFVLEYMASMSDPQPDVALRDCGFASWYVVPPLVRPPAPGSAPVPDPDFAQEPEPFLASDVRALFADALESGRSRVWAGCAGLNLFADLGDLKTAPAVTETRWRYSGELEYVWDDSRGTYPDVRTGTLALEEYDFGEVDPGEYSPEPVVFHSEPDSSGGRVLLVYDRTYAEWEAYYYVGGVSVRPVLSVQYPAPNLTTLSSGTAVDPTDPSGRSSCTFRITRTPYEHGLVPARTYREWGSSPLSAAASFSFRSLARLEPTDRLEWYAGHPPTSDSAKYNWFERVFGIWLADPDIEGGVRVAGDSLYPASWDTGGIVLEGGPLEAWSLAVGDPPPDPYSGTVEWADSVTRLRDRPPVPSGFDGDDDGRPLPDALRRGLPDGWYLASSDWWVVASSGTSWSGCREGMNWAVHRGDDTDWEDVWEPSGAPDDGAGRFDLEYVASAPAAGGAAGPLCPGGVPVPVQSADSVAVLPLFCATVTVETTAVKAVTRTFEVAYDFPDGTSGSYARSPRSGKVVHSAETRYVVGFVPCPCLWSRDAGSASAPASGRSPLGASGPAGLWDFVRARVLGPLGIPSARDLLSGAGVSYERYEEAAMGEAAPGFPIPHHSVCASASYFNLSHDPPQWEVEGGPVQVVDFALDGDSVEYASVSGTVEFPFCVYESGYCA